GPIRTSSMPHEYANLPAVHPAEEAATATLPMPSSSSFHRRMLVRKDQQKPVSSSKLIQSVRTIDEFTDVLDENHDFMVALWVSPWCKACRSMEPAVRALAKKHPNVKFIQIPVVDSNANLHQGLEVPSVPFVHLYLSDSQLAEEQKINRKRIPAFHSMLQDYEAGACSLEKLGKEQQWSISSPYSTMPTLAAHDDSHRATMANVPSTMRP
ncbi:MAG: hypothetical protein SGILL_002035, partial [Bacillariaceae sp.]